MGQTVSPPSGTLTVLTVPVHVNNSNSIPGESEIAVDDLFPVDEVQGDEHAAAGDGAPRWS